MLFPLLKQCKRNLPRCARLSSCSTVQAYLFPITAFVLLFKAMAVALAAQITAAALLIVTAVVEWNPK